MSAPTLINLPPPPSDPATPSEMPGTPNSTTTSMSELSTVAIKDGHRGHPHHHHTHDKTSHPTLSSLDAERADRISRLAGLERVATARSTSQMSLPPGASAATQQEGYFGTPVPPSREKERSTVGSASATGSVGGRTTWASGSDQYDPTDKMSEDMETSSNGMSEENGSLVGFGEAASSTVSGPVSTAPPGMRTPQRQSTGSRFGGVPPPPGYLPQPMTGISRDSRAADYDLDSAANSTPPAAQSGGTATAERIMTGTFDADDDVDMGMSGHQERELGKFGFEGRR